MPRSRTSAAIAPTQTYARLLRDYGTTRDAAGRELTCDDLTQRINIVEQANFRRGVTLERTFDYDGAIRFYLNVATDPRFNAATDHEAHVHDALASVARIATGLGRWHEALSAWRAFAPHARDEAERAEARFRVVEIPYLAHRWAAARRSFGDYLRVAPETADHARYRAQAAYELAQACLYLGDRVASRQGLRDAARISREARLPLEPAGESAGERVLEPPGLASPSLVDTLSSTAP